jgi:hypothetical protein
VNQDDEKVDGGSRHVRAGYVFFIFKKKILLMIFLQIDYHLRNGSSTAAPAMAMTAPPGIN